MKPSAETGYEELAADLAARVDEACDRFEEAWEGGTRPRIEEFLPDFAQLSL